MLTAALMVFSAFIIPLLFSSFNKSIESKKLSRFVEFFFISLIILPFFWSFSLSLLYFVLSASPSLPSSFFLLSSSFHSLTICSVSSRELALIMLFCFFAISAACAVNSFVFCLIFSISSCDFCDFRAKSLTSERILLISDTPVLLSFWKSSL